MPVYLFSTAAARDRVQVNLAMRTIYLKGTPSTFTGLKEFFLSSLSKKFA